MHAQKWPLFLPETREKNTLFWGTQEKCGMHEYLFHILEYFSNIQVLPLKIQFVLNKSDIQKATLNFEKYFLGKINYSRILGYFRALELPKNHF